ncbi:four helix bundle protein [bacterium]|nr:four helix bundle protein [bacterium]
MQDYHNLVGWQKSHKLAKQVYRVTAAFPSHERYGITSQLRRAAASIPTNLAEGSARISNADFVRFIHYSLGSAAETEYLLFIAFELNYLGQSEYQQLAEEIEEVKKIIQGLRKKLRGG